MVNYMIFGEELNIQNMKFNNMYIRYLIYYKMWGSGMGCKFS